MLDIFAVYYCDSRRYISLRNGCLVRYKTVVKYITTPVTAGFVTYSTSCVVALITQSKSEQFCERDVHQNQRFAV